MEFEEEIISCLIHLLTPPQAKGVELPFLFPFEEKHPNIGEAAASEIDIKYPQRGHQLEGTSVRKIERYERDRGDAETIGIKSQRELGRPLIIINIPDGVLLEIRGRGLKRLAEEQNVSDETIYDGKKDFAEQNRVGENF